MHIDREQSAAMRHEPGAVTTEDIDRCPNAARSRRRHALVVRCEGTVIEHPHMRTLFARDIALLHEAGIGLVIVHGFALGAAPATETSGPGRPLVSDLPGAEDEPMVAVETALRKVNQGLARLLTHQRVPTAGLGGWETSCIRAWPGRPASPEPIAAPGRAGDIEMVNPGPIRALLERGVVPILAPLGIGSDTLTYRVSADLAAGEVAAVLAARAVIFIGNAPWVVAPDGCRYRQLSRWGADALVREGVIDDRTLVKVDGAVRALKGGVEHAQFADGRVPHVLLRTLRSPGALGTEIVL